MVLMQLYDYVASVCNVAAVVWVGRKMSRLFVLVQVTVESDCFQVAPKEHCMAEDQGPPPGHP